MSETGDRSSQNWRQKWFPDRQIYLRTQGKVRFFALPSKAQVTGAVLLTALAGWVIFASAKVLLRDVIIEAKNQQIETLDSQTANQAGEIERLQGTLMDKTRALEERTDYLLGLMEQDPTGELSKGLESASPPEQEETDAENQTSALTPASRKDGSGLMRVFFSRAEASFTEPGRFTGAEFETLIQARFDVIAGHQDSAAATLVYFAEQKILEFDDMLSPFKIKAGDLARASTIDLSALGQGGPYLPDPASGDKMFSDLPEFAPALPYPDLHERWSDLLKVYSGLQSVPLLYPVKDFYQSSRFGRRIDPITKKPGWHPGVDLAGWPGTEIFSPTAGVVTKAGVWGNYGNMVEVDHGNGFKTRYAHLRKIKVQRGQKVSMGDVLGEMGCSGRCVSTHLHYEVYFNNNLRNPQPFMEPEEDVQQTKREAPSSYGKGK
ncbi:MAG: M23 family metallopeptidase [Proteobacteria bacterium]|nr:M23 family metallopeptidase [Pseudomonadota bacterium]